MQQTYTNCPKKNFLITCLKCGLPFKNGKDLMYRSIKRLVRPPLLSDFVIGVHYGGVIPAPKLLTNGYEAVICILSCKIHGYLPWYGYIVSAPAVEVRSLTSSLKNLATSSMILVIVILRFPFGTMSLNTSLATSRVSSLFWVKPPQPA